MDWKAELADRLKAAPSGERKAIVNSYAERTGMAPQSLYRIAREFGFDSGRKRRVDSGTLRSGLSDEQVLFVAGLKHVTKRENRGVIMDTETALDIARDNGIIDTGQITVGGLNRILRERQLSDRCLDASEPHTEMRSLHPNHVHAFDVSICIQYYLKSGKMGFMDERDYYRNKPQNFAKIKRRLYRYVLVDHFSGAYYLWYYEARGETQDNLFDFLLRAWSEKKSGKFPFMGVPFMILMDRGAANMSRAIIAFLERLGVEVPEGRPHNARRQGVVERMHGIVERKLESRLRIQPAASVEELNEWAEDFIINHQATKLHTRHKMTRTASWLLIKPEELRELPPLDIVRELYANPEETRTVDGAYAISYRGNEYDLRHVAGLYRGAKVEAVLKPYAWPVIDVRYRGETYEAKPLERLDARDGAFRAGAAVIGEEFKSPRETLTQKAAKKMENMAFGEERKKDSIPFEGLTVFGVHEDKVKADAYIPRKGMPIEVDRSVADRQIPIVDFIRQLADEMGEVPPELNAELRERFGSSISLEDATKVKAELSGEEDGQGRARLAI